MPFVAKARGKGKGCSHNVPTASLPIVHDPPGKAEWIAGASDGRHFKARLAHVHGNLFSLLNSVFGLVLMNVKMPGTLAKWASWTALGGLLMPLGILGELYLGLPPYFVIIGGISIFLSAVLLTMGVSKRGQ